MVIPKYNLAMMLVLAYTAAALAPNHPLHAVTYATSRSSRSSPVTAAAPYDTSRAVNIVKELAGRAAGRSQQPGGAAAAKSEIFDAIAPYGDPALNLPSDIFDVVNAACRKLERSNPTSARSCVAALDGAWSVRFSDAPPPSNGALGPLRGKAFQIVDSDAGTYSNELSLFGGTLQLKLQATFSQPDASASALRVAFRSIRAVLLGVALPPISFPSGTERTWLCTYTDDDTRIVRAGVDGGRSTARDLGLISREEGEAADAYLFVLSKVPLAEAEAGGSGGWASAIKPLAAATDRRQLKAELRAAMEEQRKGADATGDDVGRVRGLMEQLAALNPTPNAAASPLLCGTWDILWTTEAELLALTANGFLGLACTEAYQTISRVRRNDGSWAYSLDNGIDFEAGSFLRVGSSCEPSPSGGRVAFRFESCTAKWRAVQLPLPPVGTGYFEVLYVDEELRLARDSRGDLQVCARRA